MRGHIEKRGPQRYKVRIFLGRDDNGKVIRRSKTIHGTLKDAQRALTELLQQFNMNCLPEEHKLTVADYLAQWLANAAAGRVSERTLRDYRGMFDRYVLPELGRLRLEALTPMAIQGLYTKMGRTISAHTGRPLSPRSIQYTHRTLCQALKQAVRWRLLPNNPAELVDVPKQVKRQMLFLTPEQARAFLGAVEGAPHELYLAFLLSVGCRPSEARGLQWRDLDWKQHTAQIVRTVAETRQGARQNTWTFAPCKTDGSHRTVSIPKTVMERLRFHQRQQEAEKMAAGEAYQNSGLVFCTTLGTPLNLSNVKRRSFHPVLAKADLPRIRLYDLRHTYATLQLSAGQNPKIVAEQLGHSSVTLTLDVYSHAIPSLRQAAAEVAEQLLWAR
ncbi:MAG: tyrosine recombinase XerC [Vulcanimicrobiota bacterium]